jgi:hypothetical protein
MKKTIKQELGGRLVLEYREFLEKRLPKKWTKNVVKGKTTFEFQKDFNHPILEGEFEDRPSDFEMMPVYLKSPELYQDRLKAIEKAYKGGLL